MIWPFKKQNKTKPKPRFARSYSVAKANRLLADFFSPSSSADKEIRPALRTLRDRSGQPSRNEPFAQRELQIFRTNVVGEKGLLFQSKACNFPRHGEFVGELDAISNDIAPITMASPSQTCGIILSRISSGPKCSIAKMVPKHNSNTGKAEAMDNFRISLRTHTASRCHRPPPPHLVRRLTTSKPCFKNF